MLKKWDALRENITSHPQGYLFVLLSCMTSDMQKCSYLSHICFDFFVPEINIDFDEMLDVVDRCNISPYCSTLYCTVLYCSARHCTVLYSTVLYCTKLCCTVQHCTVLSCTMLFRMTITAPPIVLYRHMIQHTTRNTHNTQARGSISTGSTHGGQARTLSYLRRPASFTVTISGYGCLSL